jgi:hypothetical protein
MFESCEIARPGSTRLDPQARPGGQHIALADNRKELFMMRKILHSLTPLAVAAATVGMTGLAGCSSTGSARAPEMGPTQLAAFSARAQFPTTQPQDLMHTAAIVNGDEVKIYNFGTQPVGEGKVWVNHSFVYHIPGIAPQSKVAIKTKQLYDSMGNSLADQKADVSSVQLQTADGFFNVQGPAME